MKAKITKVTKVNGDQFYYVYNSNEFGAWEIFECVYIAKNKEVESLERAKHIASKIESNIPGEEVIYVTPSLS